MLSVRPAHAPSARLGWGSLVIVVVVAGPSCRPTATDGGGTDASDAVQCFDGLDNDADGLTDFPNDPGCVDAADDDETELPECMDGRDNDLDGAIDIADIGCATMDDDSELNPECADGIDNDGDGRIDFGQDPDCVGVTDEREAEDADCMDLTDNDGDLQTDFPDDPGCAGAVDPSESDVPDCGGLYVTDVSATGLLNGAWDETDTSLFMGSCGGAGPEAIAFVNVPVPLTLLSINTFGTTFDTSLYVRTTCDDSGSEIICGDFDLAASEQPVVELAMVAPGSYFIFADGSAATDFGNWFLHVFGIIAPGQACTPGNLVFRCDSLTGQICTEPIPGMGTVCNAGQCSDGFDNDADAIVDYPLDPGCTAPDDNTEVDPASIPQCYNGADDDGDAFTDYPSDPGCSATGDDLEIDDCIMGVPLNLVAPDGTGAGSTVGMSNFEGSCTTTAFSGPAPEDVWVFELLYPADVTVTTRVAGTTLDTALYVRTDCDDMGSELACNDNDPAPPFTSASTVILPGLAPGTYFVFVDGMTGGGGSYALEVSGVYASGAVCDPLSTAFVCNAVVGDACQDPGTGTFSCLPAQCANGADDDGDALVDYPDEIGCLTLADDDETDPPVDPTCSNGLDDDADAITDYPLDPGCFYAADPTEEDNCISGVPFTDLPPSGIYSGTIATPTGFFEGSCTTGFSVSADEDVFIISVPTSSMVTFTTVSPSTFVDTALYLRSTCDDTLTELACNDNAPGPGFSSGSTITLALGSGTYFLFVDGMNGSTGAYELTVSGVVTGGMPCDPASTIFTCDAAAGFTCIDPGTGSFACVAGACSDTLDNDSDGDIDYPNDPGCATLADADEADTCPGAGCPQCADLADNDADLLVDYPMDIGCGSAADDDEEACIRNFDDGTGMGYTFVNTCTSGVGWVPDDFRSVSPMYSLYYGNPATRNFDCSGLTNSGSATSTSITLPASGSEVTFWYRWDSEGCGFDELTVDVDPATGPAVQVWSRCDDPITAAGTSGGGFIEVTIDLSAYDGQTVQLIWRFDTLDGIGNSSEGHYLDDIFVNGSCP